MQRYFPKSVINNIVVLNDSDIHHIKHVMKMVPNDQIEVVYNNEVYTAKIDNYNYDITIKNKVEAQLNKHNKPKIILAMSLVKEQKFDLVIQKATELGVDTIIPLQLNRCIVKMDTKSFVKKKGRWEKICKEASEQSKRTTLPTINEPFCIKELIKYPATKKIVLSTMTNIKNLKKSLQEQGSYDTIIVVVGPEGGIEQAEEQYLVENGFERISLGDQILRTETAAITILGMINYEIMR